MKIINLVRIWFYNYMLEKRKRQTLKYQDFYKLHKLSCVYWESCLNNEKRRLKK